MERRLVHVPIASELLVPKEDTLADALRVLWLSHRDICHPSAGGAERVVFETSKGLIRMGFKVTWGSTSFHESKESQALEGVEIVRMGNYVSAHVKSPLLVRSVKPDVVVDDLGHVVPWCSERLTPFPGTVHFYHLHQRTLSGQVTPALGSLLKWLERQYYWCYPRWPFVTISEQGVQDLLDLGISRKRISYIPVGVDLKKFYPGRKAPEPTMIYFGGFRSYKRPWIPLDVYRMLRGRVPKLRLFMVGDGPIRERFEKLTSKSNWKGVAFLGRVSDDMLSKLVSEAWVNLHCSVAEGWGLSIIEAAAAGTPTVAFSVPGVRESVVDEVNGILVPDGNIPAFVTAVEDVLRSPDDWVATSRARALSHAWENSVHQWAEHLRLVACTHQPEFLRSCGTVR